MRVHEITLAGFDGGTDGTDHLVVWVAGPGEAAKAAVEGSGATYHGFVAKANEDDVDFVLPKDAEALAARIREADLAAGSRPGP